MPKFGLSFFTPKGFTDEKVMVYSSIGATHKITPPVHCTDPWTTRLPTVCCG